MFGKKGALIVKGLRASQQPASTFGFRVTKGLMVFNSGYLGSSTR